LPGVHLRAEVVEAHPRSVTPRPAGCLRPLPPDTLKGIRDRAILATLLYHGIRREELCLLTIGDMQTHEGVMHLRIQGKRDKSVTSLCIPWRSG
jgi:integrase